MASRPPKRQRRHTTLDNVVGAENSKQTTLRNFSANAQKKSTSGKIKTKDNHSFFNAKTKAQTAQEAALEEDHHVLHLDGDLIIDGDEDGALTQGTPPKAPEIIQLPPSSRPASKQASVVFAPSQSDTSRPSHAAAFAGVKPVRHEVDSRSVTNAPWAEAFPPASIAELAVHKKKTAEVKSWLEQTFSKANDRVSTCNLHHVYWDVAD